jgi:polyisoprenoid-binding protein YceI
VSTTEISTIAPAGTWQLDPVHSTIGFEVAYLGGTFKGQFREATAELKVEDGIALEGVAKVASVDVKDENLAAHLQSPDFFDAERHPELRFVARNVDLAGETVTVEGEITIKGVTKPVEFTGTAVAPTVDLYGRERIGFTAEASIDRDEFGVSWNAPLPSGEPALSNEVTIVTELFFTKAA